MTVLAAQNDMPQPPIGVYSAIIYVDGNLVIAKDANGNTIFSGTACIDDFTVINLALALGGNVRLRAGTYQGNADITIGANASLIGDGLTNTILNFITSDHSVLMTGDYAQLRDLSFTGKGNVWITANNTCCENVIGYTIRRGLSVSIAGDSAFVVYCAKNTTLQGHEFINCIGQDTIGFAFMNDGNRTTPANQVIKNQIYINCKAIDCGRNARNETPSWVSGFDVCEVLTSVSNITYIGCHAEGCWESGFHAEISPAKSNIKFVGCTSINNAIKPAPDYGCGFMIGDGCELIGCHSSGNYRGAWIYGSLTGEPVSVNLVTESNTIQSLYIYSAKNLKVDLYSYHDGPLLLGGNISNMYLNAIIEEAISEALDRYTDSEADRVLNSKVDITDINSACTNNYCLQVEKFQDCDIKIKLVRNSMTFSDQYYIRIQDITRTKIYIDAFAPDKYNGCLVLLGGANTSAVLSGILNGAAIGIASWISATLSGDFLIRDLTLRNEQVGIKIENNASIIAGSVVLDHRSILTTGVGTKVLDGGAKTLYYSNFGLGTGTGSSQAIAHKLIAVPNKVTVTGSVTGANISNIYSDATYIYVSASSGKAFKWSAEI